MNYLLCVTSSVREPVLQKKFWNPRSIFLHVFCLKIIHLYHPVKLILCKLVH